MGFFDALTADAYPRDSHGRRVFAPYGRRRKAYVLPDERAEQLRRFHRRGFQGYFVALLGAALAFGPWAVLAVGVFWMTGLLVGLHIMTRGLEEATERPVLPRDERVRRGMRAMGRPTMYFICLAGAGSATVGAAFLVRGERSVSLWFITLYGAAVAILYARQLTRADTIPPTT